MNTKNLRNSNLAYDDQGSGQVILFIHGYPLNRQMWAPQVAGLSQHARVLVVDLHGHGDSIVGDDDHSMDNLAEDCKELLESLSIRKPVVLCGLSMGGYITLAFYRRNPELLAGMVLTATRAAADTPAAREGREKAIQTVKESGSGTVIEAMLPKLLSPVSLANNPELVNHVRQIMTSITDRTFINDLVGLKDRPDSTRLLPTMHLPVLIIHGEDDQIVPLEEARLMQRAIPDARLEVIPQAGHLLNLEQPVAFNRAVQQFLAEIQGG